MALRIKTSLVLIFLIVFILTPFVLATNKWEYQDYHTTAVNVYGTTWYAQTFNSSTSYHSVSAIYVWISRYGTSYGDVNFSIANCTSAGFPSNTLLMGNQSASTIPTTATWVFLNFSSEYNLTPMTNYSLVIDYTLGISNHYITWFFNDSDPSPDGFASHSTSGITWTTYGTGRDFNFEIWGSSLVPSVNSVGQDNTLNDVSTKMFGNWSCGSGYLAYYVFGWNNSGSWVNDSLTAFGGSQTNAWLNITKTLSVSNAGDVVQWEQWVNGTIVSWSNTNLQTFTVTANLTFYFSSRGSIEIDSVFKSNKTSIIYSTHSIMLTGIVDNSSCVFLNFTWSYGSSVLNNYNFSIVNSTDIWTYFDNGSNFYSLGYSDGWNAGNYTGWNAGNYTGWNAGNISGYSDGYSSGYAIGYAVGYADGLAHGGGSSPFIMARFTINYTAPYQTEPVFFNGTSSNASSTITSFSWNFGDNGTDTGNETTHIYSVDGVFLVNLTVVSGSMISSMLQNITVLSTTINLTFDWNDILFGSGAWICFIVIVALMFVGVTINKYFILAAFPIMALMALEYFTKTTSANPLVWNGLIMAVCAVVLLIYSAIPRGKD